MAYSKDDIYAKLREYLVEMFEVPAESIRPEARLAEDMDLDSIDAVDLIVRFQGLIGKKIPPEEFKSVRTVADVVDKVHALVQE